MQTSANQGSFEQLPLLEQLEVLNLKIDKRQLDTEISVRTQTYFVPDNVEAVEGFDFIQSYIKCGRCQKIPLDLRTCVSCFEVVCQVCEAEIQAEEGCCEATEECRGKALELVEMQRSVATKQICMLKQNHACPAGKGGTPGPDAQGSVKAYTVFELHQHLESECPKSRYCSDCKLQFPSQAEFHHHLQLTCSHLMVLCPICNLQMPRIAFNDQKSHKCFVQIQNLKDTIITSIKEAPKDVTAQTEAIETLTKLNSQQKAELSAALADNQSLKGKLAQSEQNFALMKTNLKPKIESLRHEPFVCNFSVQHTKQEYQEKPPKCENMKGMKKCSYCKHEVNSFYECQASEDCTGIWCFGCHESVHNANTLAVLKEEFQKW